MPISTGTISFQDIADEFGGQTPHSLNEYYRGAGKVNSTITEIPLPGSPIDVGSFAGLSAEITVTFTMTGGGGHGGNGFDDGNGGGNFRQGTGLSTGIASISSYNNWISTSAGVNIITGATNSDIPESIFVPAATSNIGKSYAVAPGGLGGINGGGGKANPGSAGAGTEYGAGGAGGRENRSGSPPNWGHWGAGGGAGGGDDSNFFVVFETDSAGWAGSPGSRGLTASGTAVINPGTYVLVIGRGGVQRGGGNYAGGLGSNGAAASLTFSNIPNKRFTFFPPTPSAGGYDTARRLTYVPQFTLGPTSITTTGAGGGDWIITDV